MAKCCGKCEEMHEEKDFYSNQKYPNLCYKCLYDVKVSLLPKVRRCKICEERLPMGKWAYCSDECADTGAKDMKRSYWTKEISKNLHYSSWA